MNSLSTGQVQAYERDGFLVMREVIDTETIEKLLDESGRLWKSQEIVESNRRLQWRKRVDGSKTADRIDPILDISPVYQQAASDERITSPLRQLLRGAEPELFKAKLISKWPETTGYELHQDYTYWPGVESVPPGDFITALLALDLAEARSGGIELFPGLQHSKLPAAVENPKDVDERAVDLSTGILANLQPGDLAYFHSMTPHRSGPNLSQHNRQSLFFTYVTAGHRGLTKAYYSARAADFMEPS
jgi:ectoine hydroxylase-related dioxygenase (phytanoyl-CoA dioxygenase family)